MNYALIIMNYFLPLQPIRQKLYIFHTYETNY